jgi:microcystin-dependent protein
MSEPFIGQIMLVGFNYCPRGWAEANGALLPIAQNTALFSLLGTTYSGDGRTTFGLPDLRGRVPIGDGTGAGLSPYQLGQKGGVESVTLTSSQLPPHAHSITATSHNHVASGVLLDTTVEGYCSVTDGPNTTHYHDLQGHAHDLDFTSVNEAGSYEAISYATGYEEICQKEYETAVKKNGKEAKKNKCLFQSRQVPLYETSTVPPTTVANADQETMLESVESPAGTGTVSASSVTDENVIVDVQGHTIAGSTTGNEGDGEGHENRQPYLAMRYCIAITGIFPSRS